MASNTIDVKMLSKMFLAGAKNLESKKEWINDLNVFPVPDGDTGTNMTMTIMSAAREVVALGDNTDMTALCKAVSGGSLRGARGNSGVILSQLLRGFTKSISGKSELTIPELSEAFDRAV
ncbi:MAG: DAK2 domain-containing protein, partial [Acetatifactor sp.]|nr:DAK2 domain-containing protein [Acetatifactor sp.]